MVKCNCVPNYHNQNKNTVWFCPVHDIVELHQFGHLPVDTKFYALGRSGLMGPFRKIMGRPSLYNAGKKCTTCKVAPDNWLNAQDGPAYHHFCATEIVFRFLYHD